MLLRPLVATRIANAMPGVAIAIFFAVFVVQVAEDPSAPLPFTAVGLAGVGFGAAVAIRGVRMAVVVGSATVTVRGLLRTRMIPTSSVTDVTAFPALRWRDAFGRGRWSPMVMFMTSPRSLRVYSKHAETSVQSLRRVLGLR
jgi:Bacterial PH domain